MQSIKTMAAAAVVVVVVSLAGVGLNGGATDQNHFFASIKHSTGSMRRLSYPTSSVASVPLLPHDISAGKPKEDGVLFCYWGEERGGPSIHPSLIVVVMDLLVPTHPLDLLPLDCSCCTIPYLWGRTHPTTISFLQ